MRSELRGARQTNTDSQADDPYDAIIHMDFSHYDVPWTHAQRSANDFPGII